MNIPWTRNVRNAYISGRGGWQQGTDDKAGAEFDAWLDLIKKEARQEGKAEAWEEGYADGVHDGTQRTNPWHLSDSENPYKEDNR